MLLQEAPGKDPEVLNPFASTSYPHRTCVLDSSGVSSILPPSPHFLSGGLEWGASGL